MKQNKYKYEYYWVSVDLCYGGAKRGPYDTKFSAKVFKPSQGIWELKRKRVSIIEERKIKEIRIIRDHCGPKK